MQRQLYKFKNSLMLFYISKILLFLNSNNCLEIIFLNYIYSAIITQRTFHFGTLISKRE